ncbi:MAG: B12-binding domain-containing radical SAM protein [Parcubacteria group bacterium]|nr:B12-binding domain-containing radical SAM protein [Parcubacteria group bacterium]
MVNLLPSNIAVLAAYLKSNGINVKLFDTTLYRTAEKSVDEVRVEHMQLRPFNLKDKGVGYKEVNVFDDFQSLVKEYCPDVIAVSATDSTYDLALALISSLKEHKSHVIFGGMFPTFSPQRAIASRYIGSICIGEGEEALLELCQRIKNSESIVDIKNLWVKVNEKIYKNQMRKPIDINNIPYDDFSVFEEKRLFRPMQGKIYSMIPISMDRGCPFVCSFCAAPSQKKLYDDAGCGPYFRAKTIDRVLKELKFQVEKHNMDYVYFNSETFFSRDDRAIAEFAKEYSSQIGLPFWCQTHVNTITEKRVKLLKDMNCDRMSVGLEHGNEEFRRKMLKKNFTNQQAIEAFNILEKNKIPVTVNNIIGFPDETRELAFDTIRLNRKIKVDSINAFFFVPYSGTPLREYCIDKGYIDQDVRADSLMLNSILHMPQFSAEEIKGLVRTFPLYIKMPESYFKEIELAEKLDAQGDAKFAELREVYTKKYF